MVVGYRSDYAFKTPVWIKKKCIKVRPHDVRNVSEVRNKEYVDLKFNGASSLRPTRSRMTIWKRKDELLSVRS
jgi:hypothetical protein